MSRSRGDSPTSVLSDGIGTYRQVSVKEPELILADIKRQRQLRQVRAVHQHVTHE
jgi:hypothetical protein